MARKAGRPVKKTDSREKLIFHARELFMVLPYEKVSTRMIAEKAGVNVAMIRYYFGNKEGLFGTMIRETIEPVKQQMRRCAQSSNQEGLGDVMRIYYQTMIKVPQFPKLVVQIMHMPPSDMQRKLLENIFKDISMPIEELITKTMKENPKMWEGMDLQCSRITFLSLMIFPFIAPQAMLSLHGIELNEPFVNKLLEHNIKVLSHGFMNSEIFSLSGDNNEN